MNREKNEFKKTTAIGRIHFFLKSVFLSNRKILKKYESITQNFLKKKDFFYFLLFFLKKKKKKQK
jgi:hypothetical protein